jgi:hypothetical protein
MNEPPALTYCGWLISSRIGTAGGGLRHIPLATVKKTVLQHSFGVNESY